MSDVAVDLENLQSEQAGARDIAPRVDVATASGNALDASPKVKRPARRVSRRALVLYGVAALLVLAAIAYLALFSGSNATKLPEIKSLAVIPLANFSGDPAHDYLADGMTEALITELSKIASLRVISRTSVMQYKTATKSVTEIARELKVDVIVAGSVQRSGDKVGITAQLIRAATDQNLWANQYERDLRDVLSLQREVARAISREINVRVTPMERDLLAGGRPVNPEAADAQLKGRDFLNRGSNILGQPQGFDLVKTSIGYFEQAVRIDPAYSLGYAGLASANGLLAINGSSELHRPAKEAARRALEIDEKLAEAHGILAILLFREWEWAGAEKRYSTKP